MSDLNGLQKHKLEKALRMSNGYVLDFSNSGLQTFVFDSTGLDILDEKYYNKSSSNSKANKLRSFWEQEPNNIVGKLLVDLLEYRKDLFLNKKLVVFQAVFGAGNSSCSKNQRVYWLDQAKKTVQ